MKTRFFFRSRRFLLVFFILFVSLPALASSGGFPAWEVGIQVFNFTLFFLAFVFLLRKPIQVFFHKRQEEFFSFEKQALSQEKERKKELKLWEDKIAKLKEQEKDIQKKAFAEGESFVAQKKEELEALRARLKKESEFFLHLETEKAKRELLEKWKDKIIQFAESELKKQAGSSAFQKESLSSFVKQMETRFNH